MPIEITMPRLSDTMEEGTLIKWRVAVGDQIKSGDLLADVETDKATMELQSYDDGIVAELSAAEGDIMPVGQRILLLAEEGESIEQALGSKGEQANSEATDHNAQDATEQLTAVGASPIPDTHAVAAAPGSRVRVSPLARKLAEEHGVGLDRLRGSGPGGRIIKRDVLAAAGLGGPATLPAPTAAVSVNVSTSPRTAPSVSVSADMESKLIPVSNMRKTIARRLAESKSTIPHFTVTVEVAMDRLMELREAMNKRFLERQDYVKLSVNDFIIRAVALALGDHPHVNASWTDQGIQLHGTANIGVAVALGPEKGGGLVVPTIRDAQSKPLQQISEQVRRLATKARGQGLTVDEMSDGTFTISNLGMLGVQHFEAIINPPQAAILAVGAAIQKPVVTDGSIAIGTMMTTTLSADHRVVDGAMGAEFLQSLKELLENPALLLI